MVSESYATDRKISVEGNEIENVERFTYLGSKFDV